MEEWETLEMEIIQYLNEASFSFDKARNLSEKNHKDFFIDCFAFFIEIISGIYPQKNEMDFEFYCGGGAKKLQIENCDLFSNAKNIAGEIYESEHYEVTISCKEFELLLNSDPIYFRIKK